MSTRIRIVFLVALTALLVTGCASRTGQLQKVARDWCLTIRASQVLPVYPLTEDVQPGDVFVVATPVSRQADDYEEKGFLPLDQLVTRLPHDPAAGAVLDYEGFYRDAYWTGDYALSLPHPRPKWEAGDQVRDIVAPRAAFPSYTFTVERDAGLSLAIPLQGVSIGLGLMGASRATGSVAITNAFTYGIDIESLYREFLKWWESAPEVRDTMGAMAGSADSEVYLRVINRVYLTGGVTVALANRDSSSAAASASAPEIVYFGAPHPPAASAGAGGAETYTATIDELNRSFAADSSAGLGGSIRLKQLSGRSVTLAETFDRPLVIGYLGFDVKVFPSGELSPPIPSFAVLNEERTFADEPPLAYCSDPESKRIEAWLRESEANRAALRTWLSDLGIDVDVADILDSCEHALVRKFIVRDFEL